MKEVFIKKKFIHSTNFQTIEKVQKYFLPR